MSILAIDYGSKMIGLALVPDGTTTPVPLPPIPNAGKWNLRTDLAPIIKEKQVTTMVVGMPYTMSGERGPQADVVEQVVQFLRDETDWDIQTVDERLSTQAAARFAKDFNIPIDSAAAMMIAETYVNGHRTHS